MLREQYGEYLLETKYTDDINRIIDGCIYRLVISEAQCRIFCTDNIRDLKYSDNKKQHTLFMIEYDKDWNNPLDLKREYHHSVEIFTFVYDEKMNKEEVTNDILYFCDFNGSIIQLDYKNTRELKPRYVSSRHEK